MKKFKYLIISLFLFIGSVFIVNAALPYEEGMKSMTLYTYEGVYRTTKITSNHTWMRNVLTIISNKTESEEVITPQEKVTTVVIEYGNGNNAVTIKCYGNNIVTIDEKVYNINYEGDAEKDIIEAFSGIVINNNGDISNPETSDNIVTILVVGALIAGVAIVSYRKRKLN